MARAYSYRSGEGSSFLELEVNHERPYDSVVVRGNLTQNRRSFSKPGFEFHARFPFIRRRQRSYFAERILTNTSSSKALVLDLTQLKSFDGTGLAAIDCILNERQGDVVIIERDFKFQALFDVYHRTTDKYRDRVHFLDWGEVRERYEKTGSLAA